MSINKILVNPVINTPYVVTQLASCAAALDEKFRTLRHLTNSPEHKYHIYVNDVSFTCKQAIRKIRRKDWTLMNKSISFGEEVCQHSLRKLKRRKHWLYKEAVDVIHHCEMIFRQVRLAWNN